MTVKKKCGMILKSVTVCDRCHRGQIEYRAKYVLTKGPAELCAKCTSRLIFNGEIYDKEAIK
jgi:hypothetical protein